MTERLRSENIQLATNEELLSGLVDTAGVHVGPQLVADSLSGDIEGIWVMGMEGKTSLIGQLGVAIRRHASLHKIPTVLFRVFYDDLLRDTAKNQAIWDTPEFNNMFVELVHHPRDKEVLYSEEGMASQETELIEGPAIGKKGPRVKDRVVSAFETVATGKRKKLLFVDLISHPLALVRAIETRRVARNFPQDIVVRFLREDVKVVVLAHDTGDDLELGKRVKAKVRWMANEPQMRTIRGERMLLASSWQRQNKALAREEMAKIIIPENYKPTIMARTLLEEFNQAMSASSKEVDDVQPGNLTLSSLLLQETWQPEDILLQAAYERSRFLALGIPEDRFMIVFSPYNSRYIHWILNS